MSRQLAKRLRKEMTDAERILWPHLRQIEVAHTHFRRQVAIGPYVADFCCHAARLIVELDGEQHARPESLQHDAERSAFLELRGYKILRFWNVDVFKNKSAVTDAIYSELAERMQNPPPGTRVARSDLPARGR